MRRLLSVVVSVYNEEEALAQFYQVTEGILNTISWDYELVFVNDGSRDQSLSILNRLADSNPKVKVVSFSRNFGHEAAMIAGIDYSQGDGIICMEYGILTPVCYENGNVLARVDVHGEKTEGSEEKLVEFKQNRRLQEP